MGKEGVWRRRECGGESVGKEGVWRRRECGGGSVGKEGDSTVITVGRHTTLLDDRLSLAVV